MRRVLIAFTIIFSAVAAIAQTNGLSKAEIQGQQLVFKLLQEVPAKSFNQKGVIRIKPSTGKSTYVPFFVTTLVTNDYWETRYEAQPTNNGGAFVYGAFASLQIIHRSGQPNEYVYSSDEGTKDKSTEIDRLVPVNRLHGNDLMSPFAGSDFWIADLGLEFFHWPEQKVLKHESRSTRACAVLESTNPNPAPGSYSRVVSWIDNESGALVSAEAYDSNGKLLKLFNPKKLKKVNGQWELEDMEIQNVQTRSRTWIIFDLKSQ